VDRKISARIAGLTSWFRDPDGKREDARKGGASTLRKHGRQHFVRMRQRQLKNGN